MKLLIIGQGVWASKIQSVLKNLASDINASSVSARFALENPAKIFEIYRDFEIIWICTKPEWQLELLPKLSKFDGKLILEKPYIVDELSSHQISEFLSRFNGVLQISEPWTFSNIWNEAKKEIQGIVDMPDRDINLMLIFLHQNKGVFPKRRRDQFSKLNDEEILKMQEVYKKIYEVG
jgi:hypothetical protein